MFAVDSQPSDTSNDDETSSIYNNLDECIDAAQSQSKDLFSIAKLVQSQKPFKRQKTEDLKPIVFVRLNSRSSGKAKPITLKALVDTGGSSSLVTAKHVTKLKRLKDNNKKTVWTTPAGELHTTERVRTQFTIPELHDNRMLKWDLHVTKDLGIFDMIIGRDIMRDLGMDVKFSTNTIEWDNSEIPLRDSESTVQEHFHITESDSMSDATDRLRSILDAKYEAADLKQVAAECSHLTNEEQQLLLRVLEKHKNVFDGTLGKWNGSEYNIDLKPDARPYHARAYPIPRVHLQTLKMEVERLCKIGVLKRVNRSEWAAPTFIIPKKDGSVRFISDFWELNKRIRRKPFPIPKIQDMLLNLEGFQYATSLDLNMGYYHIELNPDSKKYCTIVLPFGKFEYQRLPMGLCNSPDIFQEKVSELMVGLEFVRAYIDDVLIHSSSTLEDHLDKLDEVLKRIKTAGLKVNAKKSFFARGGLEYLGYWITREGIQPIAKKVDAIKNIAEPTNKRELRKFIGIVNYYRDMWIRRSHCLAPLAALTSKNAKWRWGNEERQAFNQMKKIISRETLLVYPDFNKKFVIHTDASQYQLGGVISQDGKPIAFYSRKLNDAQTRYTTTERELLSIVETLKEFRNILLGHEIEVHTDHKNLTCKHFNTDRVLRWRLILEEYGPDLKYIKGENNIVADALSRLNLNKSAEPATPQPDRTQMAEAFAVDELEIPDEDYPLSHALIAQEQAKDNGLLKLFDDKPDVYRREDIKIGRQSYRIITKDGKTVLPKTLQMKCVQWYHNQLVHPGETRTELTIAQHYTWKGMRNTVKTVCSKCLSCTENKKFFRKYGKLPPKEAECIPWKTLCVDLIGPYTIGNKQSKDYTELHCITMIDPATGWFEIAEIKDGTSHTAASKIEQVWLSRYPWPQEIVLDRGREFMGEVIRMVRDDYGIQRKPITTRNPQANAMVERCHQTIHNMVRSFGYTKKSDFPDQDDPWTGVLTAVAFGMRATIHTTTKATPSQLVFGRDAMHQVQFVADWQYIKERKQKRIVQNNKKENETRHEYDYTVGERVKVLQDPNRKHGSARFKGPYTVTKVNDNGTLQLQQNTPSGGVVLQTWNIRQVMPYGD